ncbi:MAG: hypothetical protein SGJ18_12750 [Pseudomonadota bacterium]|nr:hypothetical protein [Pseudomonadota bacterium]
MKTIPSILISAMAMTTVAMAGSNELNTWTSSVRSPQGLIFDALAAAHTNGQANIKRNGNVFVIFTTSAMLSCTSKLLGAAAVENFKCSLAGDISEWEQDATSVQAILTEALIDSYALRQKHESENNPITLQNGVVSVSGEGSTITCESKQRSMLAVKSYLCRVE